MPKSKGAQKELAPVVIAVVMAVVGFMLVQKHISDQTAQVEDKYKSDLTWVIVAKDDIATDEVLQPESLHWKAVSAEDQPWSSIRFSDQDPDDSPEAKRCFDEMVAAVSVHSLTRPLRNGDMLLWTDLEREQTRSLSDLLEENTRAVAVMVDKESVLGGLLQPGDYVDVLATYMAGMDVSDTSALSRSDRQPKTVVALERVMVRAVGQETSRSITSQNSAIGSVRVVLGLPPDRALILTHVQKQAKISLLLRPTESPSDVGYAKRYVSDDDVNSLAQEAVGLR